MRWRFIDPSNLHEAEERNATILCIEAWWREFRSRTDDLDALFARRAEWDLPDWMATHLQAIHPELMWEFGTALREAGHRLVITPESSHELRPLVGAILAKAPAVEGWEFYDHRLAEDVEMAHLTVEARTAGKLDGFRVRVARGEGQKVDLTYLPPTAGGRDDSADHDVAFVATETLLGERLLDRWIGAIEAEAPPRPSKLGSLFRQSAKPAGIELDRLRETVEALVESIREQLPPTPTFEWIEDAKWTLWELKPQEADDYAGQRDLYVAKSVNAPMWTAAHTHGLFFSERFSRSDEVFCYLKIDGAEGLEGSEFLDKSQIEDALDETLKPARLGCHIGGGMGLRYAYIDLALVATKLDKALQTIRRRLQHGKLPVRSWIQFFDSDLAAEWVGIYDETPEPPFETDSE